MVCAFIVEEVHKGSLRGYVEGDDGLFSSTVPLDPEDFGKLGFEIKIDQVEDPCEASFCGMIFADSGEIIRDPRDFAQHFGWTSSFLMAKEPTMIQLLQAKAMSACYETPQCPIVGAYARLALRECGDAVPRFIDDGYHVLPLADFKPTEFCPADDTRDLFAKKYGISPDIQRAIEKALDRGDLVTASELLVPSRAQATYSIRYTEYG
jgi:hypothetical protein